MIDDMPMDEYLASPLVSTHKLKDFADRGARYFAMRHVSRTTTPPEDTDALIFGAVFEDIVQGRGFDRDAYAVKPDGMTFQTKEGKAWRKLQQDAGKRIVSADDLLVMQEMRSSLEENDAASELVKCCKRQVTLRGAYTGVPGLISRPDWLSSNGSAITGFTPYSVDLKTTSSLTRISTGKDVLSFKYHAQASIVRRLMRESLKTDTLHYLLAVEKCSPYRCQVVEIPEEWLDAGWQWCERHLQKLARHYEQNEWPRVDSEIVTLPAPPSWVADAGDEEEEAA